MKLRSPVHYYMETRSISFWESVRRLWQTWRWSRDEIYFRPVQKGEAGYEEAPYGETVIWHRTKS